jgi:hypothetical protein
MTFSHHTASVNGIQLHYVIGGHGDPVVLLHGWPEPWHEWHLVLPALANMDRHQNEPTTVFVKYDKKRIAFVGTCNLLQVL